MSNTKITNQQQWIRFVNNRARKRRINVGLIMSNNTRMEPAWWVGNTCSNSGIPKDYIVTAKSDGTVCSSMPLPSTILAIGDGYSYVPINSDANGGIILINANNTSASSLAWARGLAEEITAFLLLTNPNGEAGD